jgi:hypothetical protein
MRNNGNLFVKGYIKTTHGTYQVQFSNVLTNEKEYVGTFKEEGEAIIAYTQRQFDFYNSHRFLLPKGITIYPMEKTGNAPFVARINVKEKTIHLGTFKTLQEAERYRKEIIMNMF